MKTLRAPPPRIILNISASKTSISTVSQTRKTCIFDPINISWHVPYSLLQTKCDPSSPPESTFGGGLKICVRKQGRRETQGIAFGGSKGKCVSHFELCNAGVFALMKEEKELSSTPEPRQVVWCSLDKDICEVPQVTNALARGHFGELTDTAETSITITFNQATNTPDVSTNAGVDDVVTFSENIGANYSGTWLDDMTLLIRVTNSTGAAPRERLKIGSLQVRLRQKVYALSREERESKLAHFQSRAEHIGRKSMVFRVGEEGEYKMELLDPETMHPSVAESDASVIVHLCDDLVVENVMDQNSPLDMSGLGAFYEANGVLAMDGNRGLELPPEALPSEGGRKSWTFTMWVYLMEDSTGSHRALFFKGPVPSDGHRTPSVWFMPHSRHLSVRVSSEENKDMGRETIEEIPLREWTHLTFIYQNFSSPTPPVHGEDALAPVDGTHPWRLPPSMTSNEGRIHPENLDKKYSVDVYVNGKRDISVRFRTDILGNDGFIFIGKDPWFHGTRSLLANIRLFDKALSKAEVKLEMQRARKTLEQDGTALSAMAKISSRPSPPPSTMVDSEINALPREEEDPGAVVVVEDRQRGGPLEPGSGPIKTLGCLMQLNKGEVDVDAVTLYEEAQALVSDCRELHRAVDLLEAAGRLNHAEALYLAASLLLHGPSAHAEEGGVCSELSMSALFGRSTLLEEGIEKLKQATADVGGVENAVLPTTARAHDLLVQAANLGSGDALWLLGVMYASGLGVGGGDQVLVLGDGFGNLSLNKSHESFAIGLYHLAALHGNTNAQLALAHRYHRGLGVDSDCETAAFYYDAVSHKALNEHHGGGAEQIHEQKRLSLEAEEHIDEGELGLSDERIALQRLQAENEGNVKSMLAMADLYYYGARGLPRDQAESFRFYRMAGAAPHNNADGQIGCANMLLKGEGTEKNTTAAVEWYEKAAAQNHTRALNGLGYLYFFGNSLPENKTKGFEYFSRAAKEGKDGDSLFNAAHCLYEGLGTDQDKSKAVQMFKRAGTEFGHFPSVQKMGTVTLLGEDEGGRKCPEALNYLRPSAMHGSWGNVIRRGFNRYLSKDHTRAALRYLEGSELGYEVATSNAAYLFDRAYVDEAEFAGRRGTSALPSKGSSLSTVEGEKLALRLYLMARQEGNREHDLRIGDFYYYGKGGMRKNHTLAAKYYRKASAFGIAQGAYSLGTMYEKGEITAGGIATNDTAAASGPAEIALAKKYFQRTLELNPEPEVAVVIELALQRMAWTAWYERMLDPSRPWITPAMENILIVVCIIFLGILFAISQTHATQPRSAIRIVEGQSESEGPTRPGEVDGPIPQTQETIDPAPGRVKVEQEQGSTVPKMTAADDIDVVTAYTLMAQHINYLRNYRRVCAAYVLQRWVRRRREKERNLKGSGELFLSTKEERQDALQKRMARLRDEAKRQYLTKHKK